MLIDAADGKVLWEKNATQPRAIASTTKIVTALVVLKKMTLDEVVTASRQAEEIGAADPLIAELELKAGEQLTVRELLYGLMLLSASDAAVALAEEVSGSIEAFVDDMNREVRALGATDTQFRNPHGLDEPGHESTAIDMAVIAMAAMKEPRFAEIVSTSRHELNRAGRPPMLLENRNRLLEFYPGATGVKTGQTMAAGRALVASATRGQESRISVVLASQAPETESTALLNYGFEAFERIDLASPNQPWGTATYGDGRSFLVVAKRSMRALIPSDTEPPEVVFDPDQRQLRASLPDGPMTVQVDLICLRDPCRRSVGSLTTPATLIWGMVSPALRAIASLL
ncbi:MAG: D-alanyl-D-alanine carboxypeptidase [Actinobacteria bacterium]|nr:D-alanyl-D-alanine carboxypeptidase [Actinomycetota bacterium]